MLKPILIAFLFITAVFNALAQDQQPKPTGKFDFENLKRDEAAFMDREGKKFIQPGLWTCLDGAIIDISKEQKPTILFLGFASCVPCRLLMTALSEVIQEKAYRNYSFIYLTFDSKGSINEEIDTQVQQHLKIVQVSKEYIAQHNLAMCYPTIFFLRADNTVDIIQRGGLTENKNQVKHWWRKELDKLK